MQHKVVRSAADLGETIRSARQSRGMSQEALARALGVSRRYVYTLESGAETVHLRRILTTLDELGLQMVVDAPQATRATGKRKPAQPSSDADGGVRTGRTRRVVWPLRRRRG